LRASRSDATSPADRQVQCGVADHVFLAADQAAAADLVEDVAHVEVVVLRCAFGVAQKAGVQPSVVFPSQRGPA
jgi:hypothetical protein